MNTVVRGSVCLLGAAIIIVAAPAPHAAEHVTISYAGDLARLARLARTRRRRPRACPPPGSR